MGVSSWNTRSEEISLWYLILILHHVCTLSYGYNIGFYLLQNKWPWVALNSTIFQVNEMQLNVANVLKGLLMIFYFLGINEVQEVIGHREALKSR